MRQPLVISSFIVVQAHQYFPALLFQERKNAGTMNTFKKNRTIVAVEALHQLPVDA